MSTGRRLRVGVLFGGRSAEHEVSILSARTVASALDPERFEPVLVGIDKEGGWQLCRPDDLMLTGPTKLRALEAAAAAPQVAVRPFPAEAALVAASPSAQAALASAPGAGALDVVFPVLHGPHGEDGCVQGLLELAGIPYVGAGVLGSAVGMDKEVLKRLLREDGVPVVPYRVVKTFQMATAAGTAAVLRAAADLPLPLFVKPANLGSSVGVRKVKRAEELEGALRHALEFDTKALVEQGVDARELEVSVLGNDAPEASVAGEVVVTSKDGFYSYEAKYLDENGATLRIPADLPAPLAERVRGLAVRAFQALECAGMARVDLFLDRRTGELFVNEINTLPGFTAISMYPKLWEASGVPLRQLVGRLIDLALERHAARARLRSSYGG